MKHRLETNNSTIEIIDNPEDTEIILNITTHSTCAYIQLVMSRHQAIALAHLLKDNEQ